MIEIIFLLGISNSYRCCIYKHGSDKTNHKINHGEIRSWDIHNHIRVRVVLNVDIILKTNPPVKDGTYTNHESVRGVNEGSSKILVKFGKRFPQTRMELEGNKHTPKICWKDVSHLGKCVPVVFGEIIKGKETALRHFPELVVFEVEKKSPAHHPHAVHGHDNVNDLELCVCLHDWERNDLCAFANMKMLKMQQVYLLLKWYCVVSWIDYEYRNTGINRYK
jgi:hypothetical protein